MNLFPKVRNLLVLLSHSILQLLKTFRQHHRRPILLLLGPGHQQGDVLTKPHPLSDLFPKSVGQLVVHPTKVVKAQSKPRPVLLLLPPPVAHGFTQRVDRLTLGVEVLSHPPEALVHLQHCCLQIPTNSGHLLSCGVSLMLEPFQTTNDGGDRRPNRLQSLIVLTLPSVSL